MFAIFGEAKIPITEQTTVAEVKSLLSNLYPEIANYQAYTDEDGNMKFRPVGGTKGRN